MISHFAQLRQLWDRCQAPHLASGSWIDPPTPLHICRPLGKAWNDCRDGMVEGWVGPKPRPPPGIPGEPYIRSLRPPTLRGFSLSGPCPREQRGSLFNRRLSSVERRGRLPAPDSSSLTALQPPCRVPTASWWTAGCGFLWSDGEMASSQSGIRSSAGWPVTWLTHRL